MGERFCDAIEVVVIIRSETLHANYDLYRDWAKWQRDFNCAIIGVADCYRLGDSLSEICISVRTSNRVL